MSDTNKKIQYEFSAKDTNTSNVVGKISKEFDTLGEKAEVSVKRINKGKETIETFGKEVQNTGRQINYFSSNLSNLATSLNNTDVKMDKINNSMDNITNSNKVAVASFNKLENELAQLTAKKINDVEASSRMNSELKQTSNILNTNQNKLQEVGNTLKLLQDKKRVLNQELIKAQLNFGKENDKVKQLQSEYSKLSSRIDSTQKEYDKESNTLKKVLKSYDSLKNKLNVYTEKTQKIKQSNDALDKLNSSQERAKSQELNLSSSIAKTSKALQTKIMAVQRTNGTINNYTESLNSLNNSLKNEFVQSNATASSISEFSTKLKIAEGNVQVYSHKIKKLALEKEELGNTIKQREADFKKLTSSMKLNESQSSKMAQDIAKLKNEYNELDNELEQARGAFNRLQSEFKQLENNVNSCKSKLTGFTASLKNVVSETKKANSGLKTLGEGVKGFGNSISGIGRQMTSLGSSMRWMTVGGTAVFGGAIAGGLEFDKVMADVASTIDKSGMSNVEYVKTLQQIEEKARALAKATIFSPSEVGEGMKYLALAGYDVSEMLASIEPMLKMAQIGNLDLASATDLLTDAMASYQLKVSDMPRFLDVMARLQSSSNTNVAQATEAYIWAGGALADLNIPLEESATLLGLLADQGLKGAEAGRSLSSIMINLTKKSGESAKALEELNKLTGIQVSAWSEDGTYVGATKQLENIKKALSMVTEEQRFNITSMIAGKTQMKTFTKMLNGLGSSYDTLYSKLRNADGALNDMHKTVSSSNWAKFKEMLSAIQEALLNVWEVIQPMVMYLVQKITDLANKFSSLSESQQLSIVKFIAMATVLPLIITGLGLIVIAIGGVVSAIGSLILFASKIVGVFTFVGGAITTFFNNIVKASTITEFLGMQFPKIAGLVKALGGAFSKFAGLITGTLVPAVGGLITALFGITLPAWAIIGVIGAVVGAVVWMVSAWKRGFDETAGILENIGNMFRTMGEDIGHFFISIWNGLASLIGKLAGKSKEEIEGMKKVSKKDKRAQEEGYSSHKEKKKAEKKQNRKDNMSEALQNGKNLISDFASTATKGITMNIDDGGFFGEFSNFFGDYKEFEADFTKGKKGTFETKLETDTLDLLEAKANLDDLKANYSNVEIEVETSREALKHVDSQIQALVKEKRELEVNPETNKSKIADIQNQLNELTKERKGYIEIIEGGNSKLQEIKEMEESLKDKHITITAEYKELGKEGDLNALLKQETFFRQFGFEFLHDNFNKDVKAIEERIKNIPNEIGELEKALSVELDEESKQNAINQLTSLQEEQIMLDLVLQYVNETEILSQTQATIDTLKGELNELNIEASKIEWVSSRGQELTQAQKTRLEDIKTRISEINNLISEQESAQNDAKATLDAMGSDSLAKIVEYTKNAKNENQQMAQEADKAKNSIDGLKESANGVDLSEAKTQSQELATEVESTKTAVDELNTSLEKPNTVNVDTATAEEKVRSLGNTIEGATAQVSAIKGQLQEVQNTASSTNVSGLQTGLQSALQFVVKIRETLISINNIASSTSVAVFTLAGTALLNKMIEARDKLIGICGVARNSGVSAMRSMGQALSTALNGARDKVISVANVARNSGASAMRAMGDALVSRLNQARSIVSSIASTANSIKVSVPKVASGGGAPKTKATPMAMYPEYKQIKGIGQIVPQNNNTVSNNNTSNTANFNIDRLVLENRRDIKDTARRFTTMCQREGIFK